MKKRQKKQRNLWLVFAAAAAATVAGALGSAFVRHRQRAAKENGEADAFDEGRQQ